MQVLDMMKLDKQFQQQKHRLAQLRKVSTATFETHTLYEFGLPNCIGDSLEPTASKAMASANTASCGFNPVDVLRSDQLLAGLLPPHRLLPRACVRPRIQLRPRVSGEDDEAAGDPCAPACQLLALRSGLAEAPPPDAVRTGPLEPKASVANPVLTPPITDVLAGGVELPAAADDCTTMCRRCAEGATSLPAPAPAPAPSKPRALLPPRRGVVFGGDRCGLPGVPASGQVC